MDPSKPLPGPEEHTHGPWPGLQPRKASGSCSPGSMTVLTRVAGAAEVHQRQVEGSDCDKAVLSGRLPG